MQFLPLVGALLLRGDTDQQTAVVDALRRLLEAQRIEPEVLLEPHPHTGMRPLCFICVMD